MFKITLATAFVAALVSLASPANATRVAAGSDVDYCTDMKGAQTFAMRLYGYWEYDTSTVYRSDCRRGWRASFGR